MYNFSDLLTGAIGENEPSVLRRFPRGLLDPAELEAIDWAIDFHDRHGSMPSKKIFKAHPDHGIYCKARKPSDPMSFVFEDVLNLIKERYAREALAEAQVASDDGDFPYDDLIGRLQYANLQTADPRDSLTDYDRDSMYDGADLEGIIQTGFSAFDAVTGGIGPGEIQLWAGRPGTAKSLVCCILAVKWAREGRRVGIVSVEMGSQQLIHRMDATLGSFNPRIFRQRGLAAKTERMAHKKTVDEELDLIKAAGGEILLPDRRSNSVSDVEALVHNEGVDVVIIDGAYLLQPKRVNRDQQEWAKMQSVTSSIKQAVMTAGVPCLMTNQINRSGADDPKLENLAYSDSFGQDSDMVIMIRRDGRVINANLVKNRYGGGLANTDLTDDWDTMTLNQSSGVGMVTLGARRATS